MPLPHSPKKLCIFGDSHIGCMKIALTEGIFTTRHALDFEFWGADGPRFRALDLVGSTVVPRPEVLKTVLMVNGKGKEVLDPVEFDAILFMAARVRSQDLFTPLLHRMQQADGFISNAVFRQICQDWLPRNRGYRTAKAMAATKTANIFLAPTTFTTEGFENQLSDKQRGAFSALPQDRDRIWQELTRIAADDGITLIPQPEETVVNGCMTRKEYANTLTTGGIDPVHRNPKYAALLLGKVVDTFYS